MNSTVWDSVREQMMAKYIITWLDLPGHGDAEVLNDADLDTWVDTISASITEPHHILAWSLGGLVAQRLAQRYPEQVLSLCLLAISPSFVQRDQWLNAVKPKVLQGFADNLLIDYQETIKRFVALQFLGVKGFRTEFTPWLDKLLAKPAKLVALKQGLDILATTDCRASMLSCPVFWLLGEKDRLVPSNVSSDLTTLGDNHRVEIIKGAGHAPFLSHTDEFITHVHHFISQVENNYVAAN